MRRQVRDKESLFGCFNPRICKRCDLGKMESALSIKVSIHASVKDATVVNASIDLLGQVSIHASVKDATKNIMKRFLESLFQSTHL